MCFGAEAADYRIEAYPAYHADRPPMPDGLACAVGAAPALYEALGWKVLDHADARGRRPDALARAGRGARRAARR